ncbi:DUF4255 domain-containing protein, partial [Streptomyces bacillaris]
EGLVMKAAPAVDGTAGDDPGRRLRYEGADGDLPAEGFAAERERQLPPGRRKRGSAAR